MRAEYPNQLDYSGVVIKPNHDIIQLNPDYQLTMRMPHAESVSATASYWGRQQSLREFYRPAAGMGLGAAPQNSMVARAAQLFPTARNLLEAFHVAATSTSPACSVILTTSAINTAMFLTHN